MSFDLGGFLGGIIGTVGAFGVAFWTFRHERKRTQPSERRKQIEIGLRLFNIIYYAPPRLGRDGMVMNNVFNNMQKFIIEPSLNKSTFFSRFLTQSRDFTFDHFILELQNCP
ncbi:hypothetical protein JZ785_27055 [Alicyclobacillus curvatus]|nr:hypothetical protein JZ785_27055 [Alicyclobacillus curvatus]